jgi:hypothetical protein
MTVRRNVGVDGCIPDFQQRGEADKSGQPIGSEVFMDRGANRLAVWRSGDFLRFVVGKDSSTRAWR